MPKPASLLRPVLSCLLLASTSVATSPPVAAEEGSGEVRDGRLFDPGVERTEPAPTAPEQLARLIPYLGDWELTMELHRRGQEVAKSRGRARLTLMNRGHSVLERTRVQDFDGEGHAMATLAFLNVDRQGTWTVGEGNSWTESIGLWSGGFAESASDGDSAPLVLHDAIRPGGGPLLLLLRRTYRFHGADRFEMHMELSPDLGQSWSLSLARDYRRHEPAEGEAEDFFPVRADAGLPAAGRPPEAGEFDFLLGEFRADHWRLAPDGSKTRWRSNATAVHVLDGHAVLEFDWHEQDASLPDAATSILRIYNRSMRRWESLYLPNRTHRPLYFGGVREGDRIVLHLFDAQTGPGSVFEWIFSDVRDDAYRWRGRQSSDRGVTYNTTWAIDFVRNGSLADNSEGREGDGASGTPGEG
ncbi:MAG: hypothetical protein MI919_18290 [Holophagales bacterium]|nr:hypothetical protein [Holophagales bacterium]